MAIPKAAQVVGVRTPERVRISPEKYHAILDAFLEFGPRFSAVARRVSISPGTARRAWLQGWDVPYAVAICKVYDSALARVKARKARLGEIPKAAAEPYVRPVAGPTAESYATPRNHEAFKEETGSDAVRPRTPKQVLQDSAIEAVQAEVDVLQAFRSNVYGAVTTANRMLVGLDRLAEAAAENLAVLAENPMQVTPGRVLDPLEKFARIVESLTRSSKQIMEMQRLLVGAPQSITETRASEGLTSQDIGSKLAKASRVIDLMRRSGLINEASLPKPEALEAHFEETGAPPSHPSDETIAHSADTIAYEGESPETGADSGQKIIDTPPNHAESQESTTVTKGVVP